MQRRTFVGRAVAGLAGSAPPAALARAGHIPTRRFGKTGEELTIIGQAGARFQLISFEDAVRVTQRAYELGVNYFDNARAYWGGRSEAVYGAAMGSFRKRVFVTTKTKGRTKAEVEQDLHRSLKALKTDYVDLWQIHQIMSKQDVDAVFAAGGAIEAFEAARKAGKCRFIGFTGHTDPAVHLEMLNRYDGWDTILMPLNAADTHYLSFENNVLPEAVKRGLGIQAMKLTANAKLLQSVSVKDCLRYTLSLPVHCAAIGATTLGQIEDDAKIASEFVKMPAEEMAALRKRVKKISGPLLEDWKRQPEQATLRAPRYTGS